MPEQKKPSLSIFFPCYNDKGTIATLIWDAKKVAEKLTDDFEVIVIDDGSTDGAREMLMDFKLKNEVPQFKLVLHEKNRGYGGALRSGFATATKDLVFYTDGDGQYDVQELPRLWEKMTSEVDVVNGYKIKRHDPLHRIVVGWIYQCVIRVVFWLPIRDIDCDFRLMRRAALSAVTLRSTTGTITVELVKKIQRAGCRFVEAPVSHYFRVYGKSQFFNFKRVFKTLWRLGFLWLEIML